MNWPLVIVLGLLVTYIVSETVGPTLKEGFVVPQRSDIGYTRDGWTEEAGWVRDARYKEAFVDIMGHGVAADFCRVIRKVGDPDSQCVACALGTRDGMDTTEYRSRTARQGFRFSRDDYWRANAERQGRQDYCRIVRDEETGHWIAMCAVAGRDGFKTAEEHDTNPPPAIRDLLRAYEGIMVWWRWRDDEEDFAQNAAFAAHGRPTFPHTLGQVLSRGLQLNRWTPAAQAAGEPAPPMSDFLRWGERGTLTLDQTISPRQLRAISFWVYWDALEHNARIVECSNGDKKDLLWLGIEGGGHDLIPQNAAAPPRLSPPALEVRSETLLAVGQLTQPARLSATQAPHPSPPRSKSARYVFEIWDTDQRLMRLESPMGMVVPGQWQHVTVTTTDTETWWPTWQLWVDGALVATRTDGRMSPALSLTQNFLGRNVRGCIQDFRVYRQPLQPDRIAAAIEFTKPHLHPIP